MKHNLTRLIIVCSVVLTQGCSKEDIIAANGAADQAVCQGKGTPLHYTYTGFWRDCSKTGCDTLNGQATPQIVLSGSLSTDTSTQRLVIKKDFGETSLYTVGDNSGAEIGQTYDAEGDALKFYFDATPSGMNVTLGMVPSNHMVAGATNNRVAVLSSTTTRQQDGVYVTLDAQSYITSTGSSALFSQHERTLVTTLMAPTTENPAVQDDGEHYFNFSRAAMNKIEWHATLCRTELDVLGNATTAAVLLSSDLGSYYQDVATHLNTLIVRAEQ